jgi:phenylacetate-CoA ligase
VAVAKGSRAKQASGLYFDALDVRAGAERERALMAALPRQVAHAMATAPALGHILRDVTASRVTSRSMLATLPVVRKHEDFMERQAARSAHDPFAGFSAVGWNGVHGPSSVRRVFQSPGPLYEPEGHGGDFERTARAMFAAGFKPGELVHNSFSYHLTPAGAMMEAGALALGCAVFPGGTGNTDLQLRAILDLRPTCYVGTPSFLKVLLERAAAQGIERLSFTKALVSGEAFPSVARSWLQERGIDAYQCYVTAELGLIAYETAPREGMVLDEGVIVEIVRPGTGNPVPDGEIGEVVVTSLNPDCPLIRFGTGDLSAVLPGPCPSGRTNVRIRGWLGRANQTTKVRGMFVSPQQVAEVARLHPQVERTRLVIGGSSASAWEPDAMTLKVEVAHAEPGLHESLVASMREATKLRCEVEIVVPNSLPNDGKVIDDLRGQ